MGAYMNIALWIFEIISILLLISGYILQYMFINFKRIDKYEVIEAIVLAVILILLAALAIDNMN